jgi:MFS family permease
MTSAKLAPLVASRHVVVSALGITQIIAYGSSYYLLAVLGPAISLETGWPFEWVIAGFSIGLLCSGAAAPRVGKAIDRYGGRAVLCVGSVLFALGLSGIGLARDLGLYLAAWAVLGLGMSASLYEAAFSALGQWYRENARSMIAAVTLWGGFASTVCWPFSAYVASTFGWRYACFAYAAMHLLLAFPIHFWLMPRQASSSHARRVGEGSGEVTSPSSGSRLEFFLLAVTFTCCAAIIAIVSIHLLVSLQAAGLSAALAITIGSLIGPSQVAGRFAELAFGRMIHPLWSALLAAVVMLGGLTLLSIDVHYALIAIVAYAAGAGVTYIVRGTLPLAIFGPKGYAIIMGRLALPSLIVQASSPWVAAFLLTQYGHSALFSTLLVLAAANIAAVLTLAVLHRRRAKTQ